MIRRDDTLAVRADLPGFTPDEVKIEVEDGLLTVSGEHQEDRSESEGGRYVRRERRFGAFSRSIALPSRLWRACLGGRGAPVSGARPSSA